ncbi:MAG: prepilin-type N-terminal cleavage/methylation domain-containing protein [Candidatus Omnitrophica bacterium]|nr:prepilin-type N-terminal cleavage/methylation domain-containing protein [Candidatus Omnitrophota bacterium]
MKRIDKKGFTLTEILIVLVVAGILLSLILPNVLKAIERGNVTAHQSNLNTINVALYMCFTEKRVWDECDTFGELEAGGFLDSDPSFTDADQHPFGGTYSIEQDPDSGTDGFAACSTPVTVQGEDLPGSCAGGGGS